MIPFTKRKSFEDIKKELRPGDVVGILTCNTCARFVGSGGQPSQEWVKSELEKAGYAIGEEYIFVALCWQDATKDLVSFGERTTAIITQGCSAGALATQINFPDKRVINANIDMGESIPVMTKGRAKLVTVAKGFEDKLGVEYGLMSGQEMPDKIITELDLKEHKHT